jgi:type II secretion system protein N
MRRKLSILGYCVFGVLIFYFFFLWQFPYDLLKKVIIQGFEEGIPLKLTIGKVRLSFPQNLAIEKIQVHSESFSAQVPDLTLKPSLWGLLWGKREIHLVESRSGRLQVDYLWKKNQGRMKLWLNQWEIKTSWCPFKLSGEMTLQWPGEDWVRGEGQAWALVERGTMGEAQRNLQLPPLLVLYEILRAELQMKDGTLWVKRLEGLGKEGRKSFQGNLPIPLRGGGGLPNWNLLLSMPLPTFDSPPTTPPGRPFSQPPSKR